MPKHTHHEGGRECRFPTKKRCDEEMTQFAHGHLGVECVKQFQESKSKRGKMNSIATCTIVNLPEQGQSFAASLESQMASAPQSWHDELASWRHSQEVQ